MNNSQFTAVFVSNEKSDKKERNIMGSLNLLALGKASGDY